MNLTSVSFSCFIGISSLIFAGASAQAQVTFTVSGTANDTRFGYITGQTYTFSFVTNPGIVDNPNNSFATDSNFWQEETTLESQIFSSITGPNLTGSLVRPVFNSDDPYTILRTDKDFVLPGVDRLFFEIGSETSNLGIAVNGGANPILTFILDLERSGTTFVHAATFSNPTTVFQGSNGSFSPSASALNTLILDTGPANAGLIQFSIATLAISTPVVPEPSTWAALTGLAAVGFIVVRRRRS